MNFANSHQAHFNYWIGFAWVETIDSCESLLGFEAGGWELWDSSSVSFSG